MNMHRPAARKIRDLRDLAWRKSAMSAAGNVQCVEIAPWHEAVFVRDSKDPRGPVLAFSRAGWTAFVDTLKHDCFQRASVDISGKS